MAKKGKHKKKQKQPVKPAQNRELTEQTKRNKSAKRGELAGLVRRENLERDLRYAKTEIGTAALRLLKHTPLPRRVAVISAVVVLLVGVGVTVGVRHADFVFDSGSGVVQAEASANDINALSASASFTKDADGVYRWHGDAGPARDQETWNDEHTFNVPAEVRTSEEPYVLHIKLHLRNDVEMNMKKNMAQIFVYSFPKGKSVLSTQYSYYLPYEEWGSAESLDFYVPFFSNDSHEDKELFWLKLQASGVDVDMELMTVSQAPLRTWDGQSKLEQKGSELFRVTGPITATHLKTGVSTDYVSIYGYRHGDSSLTQLATSHTRADLTGDEFATEPYTLDGVELLWVDASNFLHCATWTLE